MSARRIFFDPDKARGPQEEPEVGGQKKEVGTDITAEVTRDKAPEALSVSALLGRVKAALSAQLPRQLTVVGEISNFRRPSSGHLYFSLKDGEAQVPAVMFRSAAARLRFTPTDGLEVFATGRVDVYEAQGKLQLYVESLTPKGAGALELAYRQLVEKLQGEGLFDPAHKRPVPRFPQTLCVITSPTGAALRDIRRTLSRRWPTARVYLIPVAVQGEGAAGQIARALNLASANAEALGLDTVILARGGGSIEDLWSFNEEIVARAIYDCAVPVVCGVGHEIDTTIADLAADLRAPTPTGAAELAVPDKAEAARLLAQLEARSARTLRGQLQQARSALASAQRSEVFRNPLHRVRVLHQRLDELAARLRGRLIQRHGQASARIERLEGRLRWQLGGLSKRKGDALAERVARLSNVNPIHRIRLARADLDAQGRQMLTLLRAQLASGAGSVKRLDRTLEALSYRSILRRGFSVTRDGAGRVLRRADQLAPGDVLRTELAEGEVRSTVDSSTPRRPTDETPPPPPAPRKAPKPKKSRPEDGPTLFPLNGPDA